MAGYAVRVDDGSDSGRSTVRTGSLARMAASQARMAASPTVPTPPTSADESRPDAIGLDIDTPTSFELPTRADGTPLCLLPELRAEPHAWVKLPERNAARAIATGGTR